MEMKDLRQYNRWQIAHEARLFVEGSQEHYCCRVRDVSLKGVQVMLKEDLPKDSTIKLALTLSRDCVIRPDAWVAWHKVKEDINTYGLYFTRVCDADKEKIYRFLREHYPEEVNRNWFRDAAPTHVQGGEIMDDRRVFARFPVNLPLKYLDSMRNQEGNAAIMDMSAKGVGVVANVPLQPNTSLELWVSIPSKKEPFYSRGEVVWTKLIAPNEYQTGINLEKADFMNTGAILRANKLLR